MKFRAQRAQIALLLTPGLAIFALFTVYPIIRLFWMSLCDMSFASMLEQPFAGLANYREVFRDPTFWTVFVNSLVYTAVTVPGQMALGLFIAILLSGIKRFSVTFRVINYLPVVTSWVIASLVFRYIFNTEGLLNYFLWKVLGVTSGNIRWLDTRWSGLAVAMILGIWKGIGWNMVIFLAALQDVPRTLYEAAEIDGANALKRFFYITLPGISPAIFFQLIMGIINNFQYFTQAYLMIGSSTGGGLNVVSGGAENSLLFYALYLYQNAFNLFKMGKASAMAWILFVVVAVVTAVVFKTQDRWVSYGEE